MMWPLLAQDVASSADPATPAFSINWSEVQFHLATNSLRILLILGLITGGLWLLRRLMRRFGMKESGLDLSKADDHARRTSTLLKVSYTFISIALWLIGSLSVLSLLGINIAPLLAGAGVVGIAIGFGAQSLVQDILAGIFILLDEKVRVGDYIRVNEVGGIAERLDLRTMTLRDMNGDAHILQWGRIDRLTNLTLHWSRIMLDIGVAYESEPDHVIQVLQATAATLHDDPDWTDFFLEEPQVVGITEFAESAVVYRIVCRVRASFQWIIAREMRRRIWYAFRDNGLIFPFPQMTQSFDPASHLAIRVLREGEFEEHRPAAPTVSAPTIRMPISAEPTGEES